MALVTVTTTSNGTDLRLEDDGVEVGRMPLPVQQGETPTEVADQALADDGWHRTDEWEHEFGGITGNVWVAHAAKAVPTPQPPEETTMPMLPGTVAAEQRLDDALNTGHPDNQTITDRLTWGDLRLLRRELTRRELRIEEERDRASQCAGEVAALREHLALDRQAVVTQREEADRYRREAHDSAAAVGRYMKLTATLYDALCRAPRTPEITAALDAADRVIRDSAWLSERVNAVREEADRG